MKIITACILFLFVLCTTRCAGFGVSKDIKHEIQKRSDGGYTIILSGKIRSRLSITAEGTFPKKSIYYQIELKGKGKEWSSRNQPGFYYFYPDNIECKTPYWDVGYAWLDKTRKTIHLNFYWVKPPDSVKASEINGSYKIE